MYIDAFLGDLLGAFIEWGFLMAFLFNLAVNINKTDSRVLVLSFIMMISYFISGFVKLSVYSYLNWFYFDLLTIAVVLFWMYCAKVANFCGTTYILFGLTLNSILMLSIYIDIFIYENKSEWFLWTLYSFGVNTVDVTMILVLLFNKDFLKLHRVVCMNFSKEKVKSFG
tara:strand:- start:539 stop:1045 length:507 start_codon:yes stop_codon:yes gene_type:complete